MVASLLCIGWHIVGAGAIAVGWQDMLAKVFPVNRRGKFFGIANFGGTATGVLGASAVAWLLNHFEFPYSYMWSFLIGSIFIFISWIFLAMTKEPAIEPEITAISNMDYFRQLPGIVSSDVNFRRYLVTQIFTGAGNMAIGFLAVYAVQNWNLPDSEAGLYTIAMLVGQALSNLIFGWLSDRKGHKLILEISVLTTACGSILAALAPSSTWFLLVFFLSGVSTAGYMLSGIMIIFEFCEPSIRPTYIGVNNTFNGIVAIAMPLIGGWIAHAYNYPLVFTVTFIIVLIGFVLLRWWVREPRKAVLEIKNR
jgi:MFS family permease